MSPRLRVAIVDDEPLARARLRRLLGLQPGVELAGEYANGHELLAGWPEQPADVLLLDIEMPELDGFSAIARLEPPCPHVVFVTAYAEHAVRAFDVDAADYLVKPVAPDRLERALERVRARRAAVSEPESAAAFPSRLALPLGRRTQLVEVDAIDCVLAQANYVEIHVGSRRFVIRRPLTAMQADLDPRRFVRVHRSALVRVGAVVDVEALPSGRYRLRLAGGGALHSGRSYRDEVRRVFGLDKY